MFGTSSVVKEALCKEGFPSELNKKSVQGVSGTSQPAGPATYKKLVMKAFTSNTRITQEVKEAVSAVVAHTRSKIISAADVWNIQRRKRGFVQRRFSI